MSSIKSIENEVILNGRAHNQCWFAPGIAVVPADVCGGTPEVHVGVSQLVGTDCGNRHWTRTKDLGKRWTPPMESQNLLGNPLANDFFEKPSVNLFYHRASGKLIGLGATNFYRDAGTSVSYKMESIEAAHRCPQKNSMVYTEWEFEHDDFRPWKAIDLPAELKSFHYVVWPKIDIELEDGSVLCPFYLREREGDAFTAAAVMHADVTDNGLHCRALGNVLRVDTERGLGEPSITRFQDRFLMTIRHDKRSFVCHGSDGLHYSDPLPWLFEDGEELGNFNTQQHWLVQGDTLYLLYNRRSELNNGVFRCRAPLYIAEVNPDSLRIIRDSERIVFPENGARMGNFNVINVTPEEAWVVCGEWLASSINGLRKGDRFCFADGDAKFRRVQYLGDLLLARIKF
jgi:hypothetical protein